MAKAQVGDLIRIISREHGHGHHLGDIVEVAKVTCENEIYTGEWHMRDEEYVIHRKAGEEDEADALAYYQSEVLGEEKSALDAVNSPNHYTQGRFETIEIIAEITKGYEDGYVAYCVGNALKYLARAPFKHGEPTEDLAKAARYLAFANEYLDAKSTQTTE